MSATFAWLSFIYCLCALTLGLIEEITVAGHVFKFRMLGAELVLALLGPSFSLYGYRRRLDVFKPKDEEAEEVLKKA